MQPTRAETIRARAQAIRLPLKQLAEEAGVHEDTLHAFLYRGRDPRLSTITAIEDALDREEASMRARLGIAGDAA